MLYGVSLSHGLAGGFTAHLPSLIGHGRPRATQHSGQDTADIAEVVQLILQQQPAGQGWQVLGAGLIATGSLPAASFKALLEGWLSARISDELELLEERIRHCPRDRLFWAREARASADIMRTQLRRPDELLPRRAFRTASPEAAQMALQSFLIRLGQLFEAWPRAMSTAAALRTQGVRLSQTVPA